MIYCMQKATEEAVCKMKFVVSGHLSLELIEKQFTFWNMMKRVWNRCDLMEADDLPTVVCKLYIRKSNVADVCAQVRAMGITPRGFISNSVSDIIRKGDIADVELAQCAKALLESNWKQVQTFT